METTACSAAGCSRAAKVRGLCSMHYHRKWRTGSIEPATAACVECGEIIRDPNGGRKRCGPCGAEHVRRSQSEWHRQNPRPRKDKVTGTCVLCGDPTPPSARSRTKCARCSQESAKTMCGESGCDRPARARRLCAMHYKRAARAEGRIADERAWSPRRQANYERRRARKMGAAIGEPFTNAEIFDRDGWICQLCGWKVDPEVKWPHPRSASLDHVVPLSKGGAHSRENTSLACLECNVRKGDRAQGEQLALIG